MSATGTPTPNIGLRIPLGTDPASVDDINYNSNLIDTKLGAVGNDSVQDQIDNTIQTLGKVQDGLAIVANGNTHVAIPADYFVYVKGHNSLSEGLYKNTSGSTIAANATLSTSNLTADDDGGLNSVYASLNSNVPIKKYQDISSGTTFTYTVPRYPSMAFIRDQSAKNAVILMITSAGTAFTVSELGTVSGINISIASGVLTISGGALRIYVVG